MNSSRGQELPPSKQEVVEKKSRWLQEGHCFKGGKVMYEEWFERKYSTHRTNRCSVLNNLNSFESIQADPAWRKYAKTEVYEKREKIEKIYCSVATGQTATSIKMWKKELVNLKSSQGESNSEKSKNLIYIINKKRYIAFSWVPPVVAIWPTMGSGCFHQWFGINFARFFVFCLRR